MDGGFPVTPEQRLTMNALTPISAAPKSLDDPWTEDEAAPGDPKDEAERCQLLWLVVLGESLREMTDRAWLRTPDFEALCSLAGLEADYVRRKLPTEMGYFAVCVGGLVSGHLPEAQDVVR